MQVTKMNFIENRSYSLKLSTLFLVDKHLLISPRSLRDMHSFIQPFVQLNHLVQSWVKYRIRLSLVEY